MFKKIPKTDKNKNVTKPIDEILSAEARIQSWIEEIEPNRFGKALNFYENIESGELLLRILQKYFSAALPSGFSEQICLEFSSIKRNSPQFISKSKANLNSFISFCKSRLGVQQEMSFEDIFLQKNKKNILVFLTQFMMKTDDAKNKNLSKTDGKQDFDSVLDEMEEYEKTTQKQEKELQKIEHADISDDEDDGDVPDVPTVPEVERKKVEHIKESPLILSESMFRTSPLAQMSTSRNNKPLPQIPPKFSPDKHFFSREKSIDIRGVERVTSSIFSPAPFQNLPPEVEDTIEETKKQKEEPNHSDVKRTEEEKIIMDKKILTVSDLFNPKNRFRDSIEENWNSSTHDFTIVSLIQQLFRFFLLPVVLLQVFFMQFATKKSEK